MFLRLCSMRLFPLVYVLLVLTGQSYGQKSIDCYNCVHKQIKDCHSTEACVGVNPYCFALKHDDGNVTLGCDNTTSAECIKYQPTTTTIITTTTTLPTPLANTTGGLNATTTSNSSSSMPATSVAPLTNGSTTAGTVAMIGRSVDIMYDDPPDNETKCCNTNTCNKWLIPMSNGVCEDVNPGCSALLTFNICDEPQKAVAICQKTCNLCNYTDGEWATWEQWASCDMTCGNGTRTRTRLCTNPAPRDGGKNCTGDATETDFCHVVECPDDGNWTQWNTWGACSATCGIGLRRRDRTCTNPIPDPNGLYCEGDSRDDEICMANVTCGGSSGTGGTSMMGGKWNEWESWGSCSRTCGVGLRRRNRNCTGTFCGGEGSQSELCYADKIYCEERSWDNWAEWNPCSVTCGVGLKTRERNCSGVDALFAEPCIGANRDFGICTLDRCLDQDSAFSVLGNPKPGPASNTAILHDVITDVGNDYDNTTGKFTCRIPGRYSFFVSIEKQKGAVEAYCQLLHNDAMTFLVRAHSDVSCGGTGLLLQATNSAVLELKSGDSVFLANCTSPSSMTDFCTFTGSLHVLAN